MTVKNDLYAKDHATSLVFAIDWCELALILISHSSKQNIADERLRIPACSTFYIYFQSGYSNLFNWIFPTDIGPFIILGCEDCQTEYKGDCPICGPLVIINDTPVIDGDPQYASKTIPDMLFIDDSTIIGAGSEVFAKREIPKGVRFGPYQGECVLNEEEAHDSGYSWEVSTASKVDYF